MSLMKATKNEATGNLLTPKCRMVYPALFEPRSMKGSDNKPRYEVTLLVPKAANIDVLKAAAQEAAKEKFGADVGKIKLRNPFLRTGDYPRLGEYADDYPTMIRANAKREFPPQVVRPDGRTPETDSSQVYGGRWCRLALRVYSYAESGNKGVAFGLVNVQLLDHDDPIAANRVKPEQDFEAVEVAGGATADAIFG